MPLIGPCFAGGMAHLLFVRHGESEWNAAARWQGWADPPLSALGEAQANEAAERLADVAFGGVVSSDLARARRTAEVLSERLDLGPVAIEPGLRERDVGDWSGLTRREIDARWPGLRDAWSRGEVPSPPNGELNAAFSDRVVEAAARVAATAGGLPLLVVAHGGVVRALERHAGEEALTLANLGGRWFDVDGDRVLAGPIVALLDPDTPAVAPVF